MSDSAKRFEITVAKNGAPKKEMVGGRDFRLDSQAICRYGQRHLTPRMTDLLRIASTVYAVDRICKRDRRSGADGWSRVLEVEIQVEDQSFWKRSETDALLTECLEFLSDDRWKFRFVAGSSAPPPSIQRTLPFGDQFCGEPTICLYSGGLDSAAGLANRLRQQIEGEIIPVTIWHRTGLRHTVLHQLPVLASKYGIALRPLIVKFAMISPSKLGDEESSQRTRSFLFSSVGGAAAWATGASRIEIFESGIGAVNLPLQSGTVGSQATRSCHPHFLHLISQLLSAVSGRSIEVSLPFIHLTKGELVTTLAEEGLGDLARSTVSCVHYPLRDRVFKSCGLCPACLFRRVALIAAGFDENCHTYKYDLLGENSNGLDRDKLKYLKAFIIQIDRLSELDSPGQIPRSPLRRHLVGTNVLKPNESHEFFVTLFRRYRREWLEFLAQGRAREKGWARLLPSENVPTS